MSAMAVRTAFLSPRMAFMAASLPRPPQPIKPTRRVSPGEAADDLVPRMAGTAMKPAAVAVEVLINWRREVEGESLEFIGIVFPDVLRWPFHQRQSKSRMGLGCLLPADLVHPPHRPWTLCVARL